MELLQICDHHGLQQVQTKVYNPERNPPFGLLEIKCPILQNINEVKCWKKNADEQMKLKRNDNYFYQIMTQMAVTGLK